MRKSPLALVIFACVSHASGQSVPSARAPVHGLTAVERAPLSLRPENPAWNAAATLGVPQQPTSQLMPPSPGEPLQVGVNFTPPGGPIGLGAAVNGGDGVRRIRVDAPGVDGIRLRFTGLNLGPGESILIAGTSNGYIIYGRGASGTGTEWTPALDGEHAYVEIRSQSALWAIDQVASIYWPDSGVTDLLPCHVDAQCETVDPVALDSVGRVLYSTQIGTFLCSGALLNDAEPGTTIGWFLTSNSCIATQAAAESVTIYWFYQTPTCNGTPPALASLPVSQGASLIAAAPSSDASLLRLAQDPSQGQGLAAWTGAAPSGTMTTIHHPTGSHKRIARGAATTSFPVCYGELPYYEYHYLEYSLGITEAGSIGAPLFNNNWEVVGQLRGVCEFLPPTCTNPNQWNAVFGRFSRTLPHVCGSLTGQFSPARIYVDASASGAGTGLTWQDAFTNLGAALAGACPPAQGMEVWVADGTYVPSGAGRGSAFHMIDGVALYGGFAGGETSLNERNPATNIAILSGDLQGDDGPAFTNRADNVHHVVRGTGVGSTAILDGFTIRGGNANGPNAFNDKGGGMYTEGSSPRVRYCIFEDNLGLYSGGGLGAFEASTLDIEDCTFRNNRARFGGGLSSTQSAGGIIDCAFEGNAATDDGGAIHTYESSLTLTTCTFEQNQAVDEGGAIATFGSFDIEINSSRFEANTAQGGGAVQIAGTEATFTRTTLVSNSAMGFGGAIHQQGASQTTIDACRILGNEAALDGGGIHASGGAISLINTELHANRALRSGGAVLNNMATQATLLNCTLAANTAAVNAGGLALNTGAITVTNTILWANTDSTGGGESAQVRLSGGAVGTFSYTLIEGLTGSLGGMGNIDGNPLFTSPAGPDLIAGTEDDDLALGENSPARDAGNNSAAAGLTLDLRGNARAVDDPCAADTGVGPAPIVDLGAIEGEPCSNPCYANCDGSTVSPVLNANDFVCFLAEFASGTAYANCDGSTVAPVLNANDFVCFLSEYATGCP